MRPPSVYDVLTPSSHKTRTMTSSVESMATSFPTPAMIEPGDTRPMFACAHAVGLCRREHAPHPPPASGTGTGVPTHEHTHAGASRLRLRDRTVDGHVRRRWPGDVVRATVGLRASPANDRCREASREADPRTVSAGGTSVVEAADELTRTGQDVRDDVADAVARGAHEVERDATAAKTDRVAQTRKHSPADRVASTPHSL